VIIASICGLDGGEWRFSGTRLLLFWPSGAEDGGDGNLIYSKGIHLRSGTPICQRANQGMLEVFEANHESQRIERDRTKIQKLSWQLSYKGGRSRFRI
jgi:hypothetical protein